MSAVMLELGWKAFLASIITVIIAKFFGSPWDIFLIFCVSFILWTIGLVLLIVVGDFLWEKIGRIRKK